MENIGKSNILMRHGWDTILEYDAQKDRIFIHCAILLTEFVGNWISPDELTAVAKNGRLFGMRLDGQWLHVGTPEAIRAAEERVKASARIL